MAGPNTNGKNFNFFQKVTVSSATFNSSPDVIFNFKGQIAFSLINEGSGIIEYNFNGDSNTVSGDMTPLTPSQALVFDNRRVNAIWFRLKSGAPSILRCESWAAV